VSTELRGMRADPPHGEPPPNPETEHEPGEPNPAEGPDEVLDHEPEQIVDRAATVGRNRLDRSALDVLITGVIGGVEVSFGGLAAMAVLGGAAAAAPGLPLYSRLAIAGVVFPVGFVFVIIGRSELFTENFLIPVVTVFNRERSARSLLGLWVVSWLGNLLACAAMAALLSVPHAIGEPIVHGYRDYASYKLAQPGLGTFVSAILAGMVMTVLTWLMLAIRNPVSKILAIFAAGYVLFAANLSHAIVGAAVIFAGFQPAGHSARDVLGWVGLATAGNLLGGVGFVTLFRLAQAWEKERRG
jgi:formate/nitrite transporter FocA (FNT family)